MAVGNPPRPKAQKTSTRAFGINQEFVLIANFGRAQPCRWWNCSKTLHYAWLFTRQTHRTTQAVASTSHVHDLMHSQLGNFKLRQAVWQQITSCTCNLTNSCFSSPEIKAGLDQNACHRWSFSAFSMHVYSQDVGIFSGFPVCLPSEEAGIVGVQENCALDGVVLTSSVPASSLLSDLGT